MSEGIPMPEKAEPTRFGWVTLEAQEIIELKQAIMDRDVQDVVDFFFRVIVPRAQESAEKRGIPLNVIEESDASLPG
jgi:hypothetical protein